MLAWPDPGQQATGFFDWLKTNVKFELKVNIQKNAKKP